MMKIFKFLIPFLLIGKIAFGAILDGSNMTSNLGWTEVDTGAGTITWNQSDGARKYVRITGTGAFNATGIYRTNGQTAVADHVIYIDVRSSQLGENFTGIDDASGLIYQQGLFLYNATAHPYEYDEGAGTELPDFYSSNTWWNYKFVLKTGGNVKIYEHQDDGTAQDEIADGDWTERAESSTFTWTGDTIYFEINSGQNIWDFSRFYYTDDGVIQASGNFEETFADNDDWTDFETNGTVTVTGGEKVIDRTGGGAWDNLGTSQTLARLGVANEIYQFDVTIDHINTDTIIGLCPTQAIDLVGAAFGLYFAGSESDNLDLWNGAAQQNAEKWVVDTTYTLQYTIDASGNIDITIDGGAFSDTSVGSITTFNFLGSPVRFCVNSYDTGVSGELVHLDNVAEGSEPFFPTPTPSAGINGNSIEQRLIRSGQM